MRFSVGVNYLPRRSAMAMWRRFDAAEIREDFAHMAALGLDIVRLFLRWDDFQPDSDAADEAMLARLERAADVAAEARLRTLPTLFCGSMFGITWLPRWAAGPAGAGDIYGGKLLDAQVRFARAAGERLRDHPGVAAWDIGYAFSDVREPPRGKVRSGEHSTAPAAERDVAEWSRRLSAALRESSSLPVTAGTHAADILFDRNVRLGSLCASFDFASMHGSTVEAAFARSRLDPEAVPFLAMLTAAFSFKRVLVSGIGEPTCPPGKYSAFERFPAPGAPPPMAIAPDDTAFATYPCLTEEENAAYCARVLERLHADGRLGALWWRWADFADGVAAEAPFERAPHERSYGIVRSDGTEKPVAAALARFARERRSVLEPRDMPMIASDYYYRTLPASTKTLYQAFLDFVAERRA